jgi:hypothetical protein
VGLGVLALPVLSYCGHILRFINGRITPIADMWQSNWSTIRSLSTAKGCRPVNSHCQAAIFRNIHQDLITRASTQPFSEWIVLIGFSLTALRSSHSSLRLEETASQLCAIEGAKAIIFERRRQSGGAEALFIVATKLVGAEERTKSNANLRISKSSSLSTNANTISQRPSAHRRRLSYLAGLLCSTHKATRSEIFASPTHITVSAPPQ